MKVILFILAGWFFFKVKRFIKNIKITSSNFPKSMDIHNKKNNMDIQDGDFEEVK